MFHFAYHFVLVDMSQHISLSQSALHDCLMSPRAYFNKECDLKRGRYEDAYQSVPGNECLGIASYCQCPFSIPDGDGGQNS